MIKFRNLTYYDGHWCIFKIVIDVIYERLTDINKGNNKSTTMDIYKIPRLIIM